ncbi:General substrate transporter [Niveomyces insectorum RCEF 264]|uniref:General substrate transporter n=1 Tax=Niveomyces insectorum RCEF 264 TaxID=1081102 RepID=A0A167W601_9HYPO|nr:General substrate transporter [Niveomyces insectorum RCEF 264]
MGRFNVDFRSNRWAFIYCGVSTFGALCYGYDQIYFTGILGMRPFINEYGQTTDSHGLRALTTSFTSLTASIIYVGELLGALLAAPINDRWGRKAVFYCAAVCIIAGAVVQLASSGIEGLVVLGRIFIGLGIGQYTVTCLLYIGEVAPLAVRGPALMMFQFMQSCSQLVGSGITQGTESIPNKNAYWIPMGLLILLPGLMVLCLPFTPESPVWYVMKGRLPAAEQSLRKINRSRGAGYDPAVDLQTLGDAVARQQAAETESSWSGLFRSPVERRKLLYSCGAMVAQQINGIQFFYSYGVIFAQSIGISQPFTISLITNVLQVVAVAVSVLLGNKVRRRPNLLACSIIMFLTYFVIGGIGTLHTFNTGQATTIVVFSYIVIVAFNFSMGCLSYAIASEVAVGPNRNKIMSCAIVSFFFTVWVISFTAPYLYYSANLGPMVGFIYAGTTCITIAYMWFCVGEVTGRTTHEIERFFDERIPVRQWRLHVFDDLPGADTEKFHQAPVSGLEATDDVADAKAHSQMGGVSKEVESA